MGFNLAFKGLMTVYRQVRPALNILWFSYP